MSSVNVVDVECPNCKAKLQIEADRKTAFCSYCGTQVVINNENEHIYRHIDEAEAVRAAAEARRINAETDMKLREFEEARAQAAKAAKTRRTLLIVAAALFVVGLVGGVMVAQDTPVYTIFAAMLTAGLILGIVMLVKMSKSKKK